MADGPMIALEAVTKRYGEAAAVDAVSLSVQAGEFVALVGTSGSGKTTTLKMINRLVEPDGGTVRVEGEDVSGLEPAVLRRRVGYVFQGVGLFPHLQVAENIAVTPQLIGWSRDDISRRVAELLDLVSLPQDYVGRYPAALSGGERQRVGVARALAAGPKIMLMDEPFGALDPVTRDDLGRAYRALHERLGLTTIMVTHDIQEAVLLADRIVVMAQGRVLADASPRVLLAGHSDPRVAALIDMPRRQAERIADLARDARHG